MRIDVDPGATCRQAALDLLRAGLWPVVIRPGEKRPVGDAWGTTRPTEASLCEAYWNRPGAGVGLLLGPRGLVVDLEVDGPGGEDSLRRLFDGRIVLTRGWTSARGRHRLFRYDAAMEKLGRSIIKSDDYPDLELRLGFGYKQIQSVAPPTDKRIWNEFCLVADFPKDAIDKLKESPKPESNGFVMPDTVCALRRAEAYLAACEAAVSGQRGHDVTFRVACHTGPGFGLDPESCYQLLLMFYNPRCVPPWSERELRHKITSAYETEQRRGWLYQR